MQLLEDRILREGKVFPNNILKVDSFLNHQVDVDLLVAMGEEFRSLYASEKITKVLTIEASGIAIASFAALALKVPMVFAKKSQTKNIGSNLYHTRTMSFTHGREYDIVCSKDYLNKEDRILIIDDFLANGKALIGLIDIVNQSGATLVGCGIAIEKAFQPGGNLLREHGVRIESLARIASMTDDSLTFVR